MGNRNANITPNQNLGSGGSVQVTNVFNISPGLNGAVRAEIASFIPTFQQIAVQAFNQSARRGGPTSKIIGRR